MITLVLLTQNASKFTLSIFHLVSLINDNVFPIIFIKSESIFKNEVISGQANIPFCRFHDSMNLISCSRVSSINYFTNWWSPFLKLIYPVGHCRERHNDQKWSIILFKLNEIRKQRDCLNCLSKTHFISQNTIEVVIVQRNKPLQSD